jgi:cellulose synthase/poly-beta-1,6-N-acetylglucosamine synthase-like glycosyltransferase
MTWLLIVSVVLLFYVYAGYPLLLRLLVFVGAGKPVRRSAHTPTVTLIISAFNEGAVIRGKIENALALDYPKDRFAIVVISDASSDETDAIVSEYSNRGVTLARQRERSGKTAGLNRVVPTLSSEIVVFSDANAMYQPDAIQMLVRNFADDRVGCVTGEARYLSDGEAAADRGERAYWDYEIQIKRMETLVGSMVGGDGAIYAIRRKLWQALPENAINDFLNPLQIVAAGWRGIYEPAAICYEETAGRIRSEYRRRVRIVSRSWRAVFQARDVLNPLRVGLFAWSVVSHKVLRWLSGLFVLSTLVAIAPMLVRASINHFAVVSATLALVVLLGAATAVGRRLAALGAYFAVINGASLVGVARGTFGSVSGVWSTPREASATPSALIPVGPLFLVTAVLAVAGIVATAFGVRSAHPATMVFWTSISALGYVYVGYPLALATWGLWNRRPVRKRPVTPRVCLFIAAHNEETVIAAKLENALALDYPADLLDVVVASDGSTDATNEIIRRFAPRVRLLTFSPRKGKIAAIIEGIRHVQAEIVVFSDANTFLERDALTALVRNFADEEIGAVSGDVALIGERAALGRSEDIYYRYERWVQHCESEVGSMIGADGALYAIRRELFVAPGEDTILDDMAIPMGVVRARRRVVMELAARAHEQGSETAREEFARKSRVIAGAVQFLTRRDSSVPIRSGQVIMSLISHKALRWFSPGFATCAFLSSVMLSSASHGYALAAGAQALLMGLGLAGCVPRARRIGVVSIAHYFCLVQVAAVVGLLRGLSGRQSVLWKRFDRLPAHEPVGAER